MNKDLYFNFTLLLLLLPVICWSAISPYDRFTWWLEVLPVFIVLIILFTTYQRFTFTRLAYVLIFLHMIILLVGGHYTYAKVPAFDWIRDVFSLSRNHFDRLGHFAQGFVPAIVAREVLLRLEVVRGRHWLSLYVVSLCLAFSALYELIEWVTALLTGEAAEAFLGTQGDPWDTQTDMALALIGALIAVFVFGRFHDKQLQGISSKPV